MNTALQSIDYSNSAEVVQAGRLAEQSYDLVLAIKVDCQEMYEVAGEELRDIVTRRKDIEAKRRSLTDPLNKVINDIRDLFRAPTDRLGQAESLLRDEMTRYQREERAKAEATQREAEAKAAAERAEQERIARDAEAERRKAEAEAEAARHNGDAAKAAAAEAAAQANREAAEAARERVELADIAPPMPLATIAPKAQGVSSRKTWKHEVTDFKALVLAAAERAKAGGDDFLLGFLLPNDKALGAAAKSMQARLTIPGVRVYAEEGLSVRRKSA